MGAPSPSPTTPPVGRLAPSPTGRLHVGHARSFLLAWWSIRSRGGEVRLRMEDLDASRVRPEFVDLAFRDLEWLGLDWDGEVLYQSRDLAPYASTVADLLQRGLAYPCTCTRADLREAPSAPHEGASELRYPGTCQGRYATVDEARERTGRDVGVRLLVSPGAVEIPDALRGACECDVAGEVGDFLIARRGGEPTYQLAVVRDDARQGVTEVLRGDDLLSSAARQRLLMEALDLSRPRWIHVPLVVDERGQRLAKRTDALSLERLRDEGVDARALVGWIARTSGFEGVDGERAADLAPSFDLARVPKERVRFGPEERAGL